MWDCNCNKQRNRYDYDHCQFSLWGPELNRQHYLNDAFTLYAMDQERNEELSMAINILVSYPDQCWDEDFQNEVFLACGIDSLTDSEYEFVLNTISEILED